MTKRIDDIDKITIKQSTYTKSFMWHVSTKLNEMNLDNLLRMLTTIIKTCRLFKIIQIDKDYSDRFVML